MTEVYASDEALRETPVFELPQTGMAANCASTLIKDELSLDGRPLQNLASFVTTYMEPEADELMLMGARVNSIDMDEYPQTTTIHQRCANIVAKLWHADLKKNEEGTATATVGSSEAIMLAGLAMKWQWKARRKKAGKSIENPNIVFGSNVQCCWHKMCKFFEIECREADVSPDCLVLTAERAKPLIDENTIGVCPILGSTYNGEFENVKAIHDMVQELNKKNGWKIPIHVDAASGGFIAPFTRPELEWDFRLPGVQSINASGHKFGLVYAGIGWLCFRDRASLPDELVTHVNYLGGDQSSFTLNFSKPASQIIAQYYMFVRLGFEGYAKIMKNGLLNASYFRDLLKGTGHFDIVDKGDMPLVAFKLKDPVATGCTLFDLQDALSVRGWTLPAYKCSKGAEDLVIMRAVIKQNFSHDMAKLLFQDVLHALEFFKKFPTHLKHAQNVDAPENHPTKKKRKLKRVDSVHLASTNITGQLAHKDISHRESAKRTSGVC
mmetsp:Transcript_11091/g.18146  ORF Transcript_11091/g.18146 Transcript_11091/m.18146 type:complete len:495 (+) Transcript_11091:135-1619(+)